MLRLSITARDVRRGLQGEFDPVRLWGLEVCGRLLSLPLGGHVIRKEMQLEPEELCGAEAQSVSHHPPL